MLTGRRAFEGADTSETLAAVIKSDPAWHALPAPLSPSIRALLEGCLVKNHHERISDISTALFALKNQSLVPTQRQTQPASSRSWVAWAALGLAGVAAGASR